MARWAKSMRRSRWHLGAALLVAGLGMTTGCKDRAATTVAPPAAPAAPAAAATGSNTSSGNAAVRPDDNFHPTGPMHQSFAEATRQGDDPPTGENRPPDKTVTGKPTYKIFKEVVDQWDKIHYVTAGGKKLDYSATVETDHGKIEIALLPDIAPNHVRNFIALARAHYYDGLRFDRILEEREGEGDESKVNLQEIQAGCPLGTAEPGNGSIGYWLKPEFNNTVVHELGTVGACRGAENDSAACRFYVTVYPYPPLDGQMTKFGKVTQGLDVVRSIFQEPHYEDGQPQKPVLIEKVTIHVHEAEAAH